MTTTLLVHREGKHLAHVCRACDMRGIGAAVCGGRFRFTDSGWHNAEFDSLEQARAAATSRGNGMCRRCYATAARADDLDAAIGAVRWALSMVALSSATQSGLHHALRLLREMGR